MPPRYYHPAQAQFSVSISFPVSTPGEGEARKQLDYFTQYDAASLLPNASQVLANATLLPRLVPDLWMATAHGWWVQARSTCSPPVWTIDRSESMYEVRVCDLASAGADPVTFQLFFQAAPTATARWTTTLCPSCLSDATDELTVFRPAPIVAPLMLGVSGDSSHDYEQEP